MQVTSARNLQSAPDDNGMDFSFFFFFFFHYYYYFIFCFLFFFLFQFCVWASYLSATIGTSLERRAGAFSTSLHPPSSRVIYPPSFSSLSLSLSLSPNPTWCLYISRYPYERHRSLSVVSILGKNSTLLPLPSPALKPSKVGELPPFPTRYSSAIFLPLYSSYSYLLIATIQSLISIVVWRPDTASQITIFIYYRGLVSRVVLHSI